MAVARDHNNAAMLKARRQATCISSTRGGALDVISVPVWAPNVHWEVNQSLYQPCSSLQHLHIHDGSSSSSSVLLHKIADGTFS